MSTDVQPESKKGRVEDEKMEESFNPGETSALVVDVDATVMEAVGVGVGRLSGKPGVNDDNSLVQGHTPWRRNGNNQGTLGVSSDNSVRPRKLSGHSLRLYMSFKGVLRDRERRNHWLEALGLARDLWGLSRRSHQVESRLWPREELILHIEGNW
ncbi:hypothetical protein V6N13_006086 [Hibiscus sabdariffa]|uniref:Uncharacterized protein n=1 Tax=Hibiscus sabdariffa TaxID=183260 RepID=A0ABR2ENU2_9ROSI